MLKRYILIVEDEMILARDIQMKLEKMGYSVAGIADSRDRAIAILEENKEIDLVLMDIVIKGDIDGIQTAGEIRHRMDIPVVFLTAYSDDNTVKRAEVSDPYGYILKPVQDREFSIAIEIALYKHELQKNLKREKDFIYSILDSFDVGIITIDVNNKIKYLNTQASFITGWNLEEAAGREFEEVADLKSSGRDGEAVFINRKKEEIKVDYKKSPIVDRNGENTGSVFFISVK